MTDFFSPGDPPQLLLKVDSRHYLWGLIFVLILIPFFVVGVSIDEGEVHLILTEVSELLVVILDLGLVCLNECLCLGVAC